MYKIISQIVQMLYARNVNIWNRKRSRKFRETAEQNLDEWKVEQTKAENRKCAE